MNDTPYPEVQGGASSGHAAPQTIACSEAPALQGISYYFVIRTGGDICAHAMHEMSSDAPAGPFVFISCMV